MWNRIIEFLSKELVLNPNYIDTRDEAKSRLKLVLMHDRSKIAPDTLEKMKMELIDVISKYIEINKEALDLKLDTEGETLALVANIPVVSTTKRENLSQVKEPTSVATPATT